MLPNRSCLAETSITGDFELTAYVPYVENVNRWTKAGLTLATLFDNVLIVQ